VVSNDTASINFEIKKRHMNGLKFILIDDNNAYRGVLRTLLIDLYNAQILAEAANAEDALKITKFNEADIILMDVMLPGMNGIELTKRLLWIHNSRLKVLAITMHTDKIYLTSLIEAGFKGCIFKTNLVNQLSDALIAVTGGRLYFPQSILLEQQNK
jgi:DNA-binding NarL/FixJ family response regulator